MSCGSVVGSLPCLVGRVAGIAIASVALSSCAEPPEDIVRPGSAATFYVHDEYIWAQEATEKPVEIVGLPDGFIDAVALDGGVVAITGAGLVGFAWGQSRFEPIHTFSPPVDTGHVLRAGRKRAGFEGHRLSGSSGLTQYGIVEESPWHVAAFALTGIVSVVGYYSDTGTVLLQPRGQDPAFGELWTVSSSSGDVVSRSEVHGYGTAVVSSAGRRVVTVEPIVRGHDGELQTELREFQVAEDGSWVLRDSIRLPKVPADMMRLVWDEPGSAVYFLLDDQDDDAGSGADQALGLWRWQLDGHPAERVVEAVPEMSQLVAMSTGGQNWIVRAESTDLWYQVSASGAVTVLNLPRRASVIASSGWRLAR